MPELSSPARFTLLVGSGKGGVGKSTVTLNLGLALAEGGRRVGLLDADVYGPNLPLMVGLKQERWLKYWTLGSRRQELIPPIERHGLKIMSAGFLLAEDQPMLLEAMTVRLLAAQLIWQTDWGQLDFLLVDLPPGTADVLQAILNRVLVSGALLVVTPQDAAHLDARKAHRMLEKAGARVLGAVENMSGAVCPHCGEHVELFSRVPEGRSLWAAGVERLAAIPLDPRLSAAGDRGRPQLTDDFRRLAEQVLQRLGGDGP